MVTSLNPFEPPHCDEVDLEDDDGRPLSDDEPLLIASRSTRLINSVADGLILVLLESAYVTLFTGAALSDGGTFATSLMSCAYYVFFESLWGRTPGKWLTRTRVVTEDGYRPAFLQILWRSCIRFIPFDVLTFLSPHPAGWHDRWSRTRVIATRHGEMRVKGSG